jgi:bifunctional aspartokinase / homoserine dehydrogenase 1
LLVLRPPARSYPAGHPFAQLSGSDNLLVFTTARYGGPGAGNQPLVVRGPGAGAHVTAGGVFSDIIQAVRCHPRAEAMTTVQGDVM